MSRKITEIILHCSATPEGRDIKAKDIDYWHKNQGWKGIGYNFVIDLDGTIEEGRNLDEIPAHCTGHNKNSIGICYVGGCDKSMNAKDTRTKEQKESMYKLVKKLMNRYGLTLKQVHCHNEFCKTKACPSFPIDRFRREFEEWENKQGNIICCPYCHKEFDAGSI